MTNYSKQIVIALVGLAMVVLTGCDALTDSTASSELATFEVRIQNSSVESNKLHFSAAANHNNDNEQAGRPTSVIEAVYIDVLRVVINNTEDVDSGWQTLSDHEEDGLIINLMDLTDGFETLVDIAELEEGFYPQMRLVLSDENRIRIEDEDDEADLKVPSGQQSGFKINLGLDVEAGQEYTIMLNFDAEQSIVQTGPPNNPGFILKPVLRAEVNGENNDS